jgi:magnesium-protoporphyrin IX monomethyl ester (oxidative) cyclase
MDICLVYMPYGPIEPPPLGIPLLIAEGKRAGLSTRALYPTFWFAEKIGYFTYNAISKAIGGFQISEWTFSSAAFPDFHPEDELFLTKYLAWEREQNKVKYDLLFSDETAFRNTCWNIRRTAVKFIPEVAKRIIEINPKIVGCSSIYYQNCASLALLRKLKELNPRIITMIGGGNCEGTMGMVMKRAFPWVDFVVSGEADNLFVPLCRILLENGVKVSTKELPYGVIASASPGRKASREEEPPVATVTDLNRLPVPDYDDYLVECGKFCYQRALPRPSLSIETSRGCWWGQKRQCTFCGVNGSRISFRTKPAERVLEELQLLHTKYTIDEFIGTDNILDMSYFKTVLRELARTKPPPYSFFFELKSNLNEKQCKILANAGVYRFQPGIESLHDGLLKLLNKGNRAIENVALLKFAYENGIRVTWIMLKDIPGERDEWYEEMASWLPIIAHLQPPHLTKSINFDRFSQYHLHPERYGLNLAPLRWHSYIYPLTPEELKNFAYRFENLNRKGLKENKGKVTLEKAIFEWMQLYAQGGSHANPPTLKVQEEEERSLIRDTRLCAVKSEIVLKGVPHLVHRACRSPHTRNEVYAAVSAWTNGAVGPESVDEAIALLQEYKLLLELSDRFLALAVKEPLRPFVYPPEYKGPTLQSMVKASQKSYWEILDGLGKRMAAEHYTDILGAEKRDS